MIPATMQRPPFVTAAIAARHAFCELTVVHVDDDRRTRIAMSADDVKRLADEQLITTDRRTIDDVAATFARAAIVESPGHVDARWIVAFRDADAHERLTIVVDRFGRRAIVEGRPVAIDGAAFVRVLRRVMTTR